jgi:exonuclease SbcC
MPVSPQADLLVRLKEHLILKTFPEGKAEIWIPDGRPHLLMLKLPVEVTGFAVSNGDPNQSFTECYSDFKNIYASNHDRWENLNVSFVLCLEKREQQLESLYSSIETDTYFCRKFVVSFEESIDAGLETLPFIPLERSEGTFQRPPSARTLLQRRLGVPAKLAEYLIELGRSDDHIVSDSLQGVFGDPHLEINSRPLSSRDSITSLVPVRLKELQIRNFRAYRKPQKFDLNADLIVLYGPNGFGKTSFFDALDFAVTGEIGRLDASKNDNRFRKAAVNLEAGAESSLVTLIFQNGSVAQNLTRSVENRQKPSLDSETISNKKAIATITGIQKPTGGEHIRNLISLFRATHLFSQEHQELVSDFHLTSELSSDVVSRMLAFEDYSSGTKKVADVLNSLRTRISSRTVESDAIRSSLSEESSRLNDLEGQIRQTQTSQALEELVSRTQDKVKRTGVSVDYENLNLGVVRGWRAVIESRIEESQARIGRLRAVAPKIPNIGAISSEIASKEKELEVTRAKKVATEKQQTELQETLNTISKRVTELLNRDRVARGRLESLAWLKGQKAVYGELLKERGSLNEGISLSESQHTKAERIVNDVRLNQSTLENRISENERQVKASQERLTVLEGLHGGYSKWQQNESRIKMLEQSIVGATETGNKARRDLDAARRVLSEARGKQQHFEYEVEQIQINQTELQNLLSTLETLVQNPKCPLCGFDHGTIEQLRRQIETQRQASKSVTQAHTALRTAQLEVATATANVNTLEQRLKEREQTSASNARDSQTLRAENVSFSNKVASAGLSVPNLVGQAAAEIDRLRKHVADLNDKLAGDAKARETVIREQTEATERLKVIQTEIASRKGRLIQVEKSLNDLLVEANRRQISLELAGEIEENNQIINTENLEVAATLEQAQQDLANATVATTSKKQELDTLTNRLLELEVAITTRRHQLLSHHAELRELELESNITSDEVAKLIDLQLDQLVILEEAKQATLNLEVALDAAETSARQLELKEMIQSKGITLAQSAEANRKEEEWVRYFKTVLTALQEEQEGAVQRYTDQYGSRTSVIQKRLRAVYGFGDIFLKAVKDRIEVRVKRNDEALRPPDYFSQSQQQILLLSIFLTACSTQTWSSFAPILLDDPVTHFDDLNTYSFLDLLIGLLEDSECPRQFIFSTCEEKLFQLARQKFQHLGDRTRFYSFKSIGIEGPIVEVHE